jgi:hypothetical protein
MRVCDPLHLETTVVNEADKLLRVEAAEKAKKCWGDKDVTPIGAWGRRDIWRRRPRTWQHSDYVGTTRETEKENKPRNESSSLG